MGLEPGRGLKPSGKKPWYVERDFARYLETGGWLPRVSLSQQGLDYVTRPSPMPPADLGTLIASLQYHPNIEWRLILGKGRGVFARRFLAKGTLVECSPISRFPASDLKQADYQDCQALHHIFTWSSEAGREKAYGWGLLALYNHSPTPNVELTDGPIPDTGAVVALRDIQAGEELCCNYGYTWFKVT